MPTFGTIAKDAKDETFASQIEDSCEQGDGEKIYYYQKYFQFSEFYWKE